VVDRVLLVFWFSVGDFLSTSRHYVRVQVSPLLYMNLHYMLAIVKNFDAAPDLAALAALAALAPTLLYS
jgi:hypothetical protein